MSSQATAVASLVDMVLATQHHESLVFCKKSLVTELLIATQLFQAGGILHKRARKQTLQSSVSKQRPLPN